MNMSSSHTNTCIARVMYHIYGAVELVSTTNSAFSNKAHSILCINDANKEDLEEKGNLIR